MQNKHSLTKKQKYWLALFVTLAIASLISVGIFEARIAPSAHGPYTSLVWNLVLAWVPFILSWIIYVSLRLPKLPRFMLISTCTILWLIFFPNAFYILTDFQHIRIIDTPTPVWYDVIMLLWFSSCGAFLGLLSLYIMQRVVTEWGGKIFSWIFVAGAIILSSLGVYIGRFGHENSWNLLVRPIRLSRGILGYIMKNHEQALTFSVLFTLLSLFIYIAFYLFAQVLSEYQNRE